jgi:hypothetical protein
MVQFLETYSDDDDDDDGDGDDDDDDDDGDDDVVTCGLQHSLKIRNYASDSPSPIATHDYDNNDDDASSSSDHSTVGDSSGGGSNNDNDAKDANHEDNNNDANDTNESFMCDVTHSEEDYSNDEDNDYSFAYASSSPCATRSNK